MKLNALRKKIDRLDERILIGIRKRLLLSAEIGKLKKLQGQHIADKKREVEVFSHMKGEALKLDLDQSFVQKVYRLIISESKKVQE